MGSADLWLLGPAEYSDRAHGPPISEAGSESSPLEISVEVSVDSDNSIARCDGCHRIAPGRGAGATHGPGPARVSSYLRYFGRVFSLDSSASCFAPPKPHRRENQKETGAPLAESRQARVSAGLCVLCAPANSDRPPPSSARSARLRSNPPAYPVRLPSEPTIR